MKRIYHFLFGLFAVAMSTSAQNNTYSMVITMANGTTIALGPNDVKDITFKDGEVQVTGQALEQIVDMTKENSSEILNHTKRITNLEDALKAMQAQYDADMTKAAQRTNDILNLLSDRDGNLMQVGKDLQAISDKLNTFESVYGSLNGAFRDLTLRTVNLEDALKAMKVYVDATIAQLQKEIATLKQQ